MAGALGDLRVIDLTRMLAGPLTTSLLGQLGAEIIKVEEPGEGDTARAFPPKVNGESYWFLITNPNKKSVTLNVKRPQGKQILMKLVERCDIVINNFLPGVMEGLGLGYGELRRINPRIISASTSGFGQTGPLREWRCYDSVAQAMGGVMSVTGHPGGPPTRSGPSVGDVLPAVFQGMAILAAVHYRERTGRGQALDIAQLDAMCVLNTFDFWFSYLATGKVPTRVGNKDPVAPPSNCYQARDGYVYINVVAEGEWPRLLTAMGRQELLTDPRFANMEKRQQHAEECEAVVQQWVGTRTMNSVVEELQAARIACAPVLNIDQVINHPQVLARGMVVEQDHPVAGRIKVCGSVFKASETPGGFRTPAPLLGQHNEEIYCSLLGYSREDLERWRQEGVI